MKLSKENFNAGSPFSCWLKEVLRNEVVGHIRGSKPSGLIKKYKVYVDEDTENIVMGIGKLDDLPEGLRQIAIDLIRQEFDPDFLKE